MVKWLTSVWQCQLAAEVVERDHRGWRGSPPPTTSTYDPRLVVIVSENRR